jgi:hypothetical protein
MPKKKKDIKYFGNVKTKKRNGKCGKPEVEQGDPWYSFLLKANSTTGT